ncbi:MAG: hypothetical protein CSB47_00725 [Proteobacteria bacterium]|nr:MAG: hypothetical protein CSB47_00725 [Pseudomonadota bacterium]
MKNKWFVIGCLLFLILFSGNAAAAEFCEDDYYIDQTMPNGSRWDMCWTHDVNQGIRYHHIFYTPKHETRRMVLYDASVAQIHVPYDDNGARYHDVSDFGLGGDGLVALSEGDCIAGSRAYHNGKPVLCYQMRKDGSAFRLRDNRADQHMMKVFSVSRVGEYLYSAEWRFYADGRIVPSILATGALQRLGNMDQEQHGWLLAHSSENQIGLSHMHNYYWRLDFDINETAKNDQVQEINFSEYDGKRYRQLTPFTKEAARSVNPEKMRSWLIRDGDTTNRKGHKIAYEVRLMASGQREIGPEFESFTSDDFYVSRSKRCEKIASHNKRVYTCDTDNLQEFVNGESLNNQDVVVWVGVSFYHMPRSEDAPYMDAHVSQYEIVPRDWHTTNPLLDEIPPLDLRLSAADDHATTTARKAVLIDALGNDTGNHIQFYTLDNPSNGTAKIVDNKIRYVANAGFHGTDTFWYDIKDARGEVYGAQVYVKVTRASSGSGGGGGGAIAWIDMWLLLLILGVMYGKTRVRMGALNMPCHSANDK